MIIIRKTHIFSEKAEITLLISCRMTLFIFEEIEIKITILDFLRN
jgi:hypothetical protein